MSSTNLRFRGVRFRSVLRLECTPLQTLNCPRGWWVQGSRSTTECTVLLLAQSLVHSQSIWSNQVGDPLECHCYARTLSLCLNLFGLTNWVSKGAYPAVRRRRKVGVAGADGSAACNHPHDSGCRVWGLEFDPQPKNIEGRETGKVLFGTLGGERETCFSHVFD